MLVNDDFLSYAFQCSIVHMSFKCAGVSYLENFQIKELKYSEFFINMIRP